MRARIFVLENQRRIPVVYELKFHEVLLKCQQIKPKIQNIIFCTTRVYCTDYGHPMNTVNRIGDSAMKTVFNVWV